METMTSLARKANWVLAQQLGIDLRKLLYSPAGFVRYIRDWRRFRAAYSGRMEMLPCVHDSREQAGAAADEYFWQDLIVARMIHAANPRRHVDVGSRVDGFVAHVASFRQIEVFDVRPLTAVIPGVIFRQADLMSADTTAFGTTDSLSCLHALEHFGLGRYGDPLDPLGFERGLSGLARLLEPGGTLYLACPAGEDIVHFNAHRSMRPQTVIDLAKARSLVARQYWLFDQRSRSFGEPLLPGAAAGQPVDSHYTLGLYEFVREALQ